MPRRSITPATPTIVLDASGIGILELHSIDVIRALTEVIRRETDWQLAFRFPSNHLTPAPPLPPGAPPGLPLRCAGAILLDATRARVAPYTAAGARVICLSSMDEALAAGLPTVYTSDREVGATAARHFMDRGFRHFAFYGDFAKRQWEAGRHAGFAAELARFGFACHTGPAPDLGPAVNVSGESDMVILEERHLSDPELKTWLADLPRPVAIFGGSDGRALHVLQLCAQLHIEVPLHVAIAGVDNNFFICEAGLPHLSSVAMDAAAIAREVVALMRRLLAAPAGQRAHPPEKITVPPRGMVTRASSDVVAADDPAVARAMLCIRNRYAEAISIAEIVRFSGVSRSTLDRRMLARLGHTALEALRAQRLAAAQALLRAGELPLQKVAEAAGLRWGTHLCRLFKAATGQSPRDWQLQQARAALLPR